MTALMPKAIYAALLGVALAGAPLAAFAQEGPRPSPVHNGPAMTQVQDTNAANGGYGTPDVNPADPVFQTPLSAADPVFQGPRPSPNH